MSLHFQRQVQKLKKKIVSLGALVEEAVEHAVRAFTEHDTQLAAEVAAKDKAIDEFEIDVEEECLLTLALHQPVAQDLRFIVSVIKINKDLERIGDKAAHIAKQVQILSILPQVDDIPFDLEGEATKVRAMLQLALDSLIQMDVSVAEKALAGEDEIDRIHKDIYGHIEDALRRKPEEVTQLLQLLSLSRQLERIGDLTVNIAEEVIYMANGEIRRHAGANTPTVSSRTARNTH